MAGYYNIDDGLGNQITVGLQPHQARRVAQRIANELGESVFLYEAGEGKAEAVSEEIVPSKTSKKPSHHHAAKKSPAQLDREIAEALAQNTKRFSERRQDLALGTPRAVASDFPEGSKVAFVQRGHTMHGVSRGSDGGSELRLVIEDEDGLRWIVEAHKVTRQ